ncbi:MAG: hypothetical protein WD648_05690 [Planctomycetaceae bacterium]
MPEQFREFELTVGDVVQIGDHAMTVIDIDGLEVSFRIDTPDSGDDLLDLLKGTLPPGK